LAKFNIFISESAVKELNSLDKKTGERIKSAMKELEEEPFRSRPKADIKKLKGFKDPDMFRLRVGDYRVIYTAEKNEIKVTHIMKRSTAYKGLE